MAEERISDLEDRPIENFQSKGQRKKEKKTTIENENIPENISKYNIKCSNVHVIRIPQWEGREKKDRKNIWKNNGWIFPNLVKTWTYRPKKVNKCQR